MEKNFFNDCILFGSSEPLHIALGAYAWLNFFLMCLAFNVMDILKMPKIQYPNYCQSIPPRSNYDYCKNEEHSYSNGFEVMGRSVLYNNYVIGELIYLESGSHIFVRLLRDMKIEGFNIKKTKYLQIFIIIMKEKIIIGIDPGVNTGFAVFSVEQQRFLKVDTLLIHEALFLIDSYLIEHDAIVRVEDARKRKKFESDKYPQGVGSIKRDCKIWEDFLKSKNAAFDLVAPNAQRTKLSADYFKKLTGYQGRTSNHARDAGGLVFGYSLASFEILRKFVLSK